MKHASCELWSGQSFGITRVLEGGRLLEKAACSVSVIRGVLSPERAKVRRRSLFRNPSQTQIRHMK